MQTFAFADRTSLVTGAASGIGAALTLELAARGCALALVDRDAAGLDEVAALAKERGATDVSTYVVDLGDGGDRLDLAAAVQARHGGVDLLVNNAGVALAGDFEQVGLADFNWVLAVNLHAVVAVTKAFLPSLLARPGAHLVNISSLFGLVAPAGQAAYATSKYAVRGFTEALRHELTGRVGVTVVHPGGVATNIAKNARVSSGGDVERMKAWAEAELTLPPEKAAQLIVAAVRARKPRLVITKEARIGDLLARITPSHYWAVTQKLRRTP